MDETYIKIKGRWYYLYRAVDKTGQTIDFLLTAQRDAQAATCFLTKAIRRHDVPEKITIDGSEANAAAIREYNEAHGTAILIRQVKYLNNVVEQDHRGVKRVTRPMLGFKSFDAAQCTLAGVDLKAPRIHEGLLLVIVPQEPPLGFTVIAIDEQQRDRDGIEIGVVGDDDSVLDFAAQHLWNRHCCSPFHI
jgi:hypothetical protein